MSEDDTFKMIRIKNKLGEKLRRPGGISRDEALEAATVHVETLREKYVKAIPDEIAALEAIVGANRSGEISASEVHRLLDRAGRLLTLSGTYGFPMLDGVVKRFCDLCVGMIEKDITSAAPIEVHLRTMWLVSPGSPVLSDDEALRLTSELSKIHAHYELKSAQVEAEAATA